MNHVLSLISAPAANAVDAPLLQALAHALAGSSCPLDDGGAAGEIAFAGPPETALDAAAGLIAARPIDVNVLPENDRRKRLLLADMDSTMIEQECVDELADLLGIKAEVAAITERAMRGEIAFEPALRERVALLRGLALDRVDMLIRDKITLMPGALTLVKTMGAVGAYTALVSGGFTLFTGPIAARIGFDTHRGNELGQDGCTLSGGVAEPILGREAKRDTLIELRDRLALDPAETMAVGDGANDLAMIAEAGLGVAFRAKPAVAAQAHARIEHGDLTALLYLQGFHTREFAV